MEHSFTGTLKASWSREVSHTHTRAHTYQAQGFMPQKARQAGGTKDSPPTMPNQMALQVIQLVLGKEGAASTQLLLANFLTR
jgi:hypothetical protein